MNLHEYCELKKSHKGLTDEEFAVLVWRTQKEELREAVRKYEQDRLEKQLNNKIESEISKNLDKAVEKAFKNGKSSMNIVLNI